MEAMKLIEAVFDDNRQIEALDETMHLFKTEDNEIIYMDLIITDFTITSLLEYVEIAENLYKEHNRKVNLYLMCSDDVEVKVNEFPIKSEADFSIKVATGTINPYNMVLTVIKKKLALGELLDEDDLKMLQLLPMVCPASEKHRIRLEVFKIMNEIGV